MKHLLSIAALSAAALSLSGCILLAVGMATVAAVSGNPDPVIFEEGVGTRVYTITYDRACSSVESALKAVNATLDPAVRSAESAAYSGKLPDGRSLKVKAINQTFVTQVDVKVGTEDSDPDRATARDIHEKIDNDVEVVRRHYPEGFMPVWDASQKPADLSVQQKVQPNDQVGRIAGRLKDGTPVVITLQLVSESRTRVTVEVGSKPTPEALKQATELAEQISKALGVQAEEEKR